MSYPYTGSSTTSATSTGLSTQIIVKVDGISVGGIQTMSIDQRRDVQRITEVGTDGTIELVPRSATTFELTIDRIYFDRKTITEALNRQFINIQAQRYPFDIYVYDMHNVTAASVPSVAGGAADTGAFDTAPNSTAGIMVTVYENCWITSKRESYSTSDYVITQNVSVAAEFCHTFMDNANTSVADARGVALDDSDEGKLRKLERLVDRARPGSLDARGVGNVTVSGT
jgi:hypothetical protein